MNDSAGPAMLRVMAMKRPPFIISSTDVPERAGSYPRSDEVHHYGRAIGAAAGLLKIGIHLARIPPGTRTSWPHAESREEEFLYLIEGELDAWIDGEIHPMRAGDFAAFPSGTGICHVFINNSKRDALVLEGGERSKSDNRIYYPLHPGREGDMKWSEWWHDIPLRKQGKHDGLPDARRKLKAR